MDQTTIIVVSVFSAAWLLVLVMVAALWGQFISLRRIVTEMQVTGRIRVQKLKMNPDKNHAFHNAGLAPDEELSRRGYSMYMPEDVETGRAATERQTGGQFVEELTREIDSRQLRQSPSFQEFEKPKQTTAPPFLLQAIEENKRRSKLANPMANGRQSDTNPNFIY